MKPQRERFEEKCLFREYACVFFLGKPLTLKRTEKKKPPKRRKKH